MTTTKLRDLPVLPLKGTVLYPYLTQPIAVGRSFSVAAVEAALASETKEILVVAQTVRDDEENDDGTPPNVDQLAGIGTVAVVKNATKFPNDHLQVMIEGKDRGVLVRLDETETHLRARVRASALPIEGGSKVEALQKEIVDLLQALVTAGGSEIPPDFLELVSDDGAPLRAAYVAASMVGLEVEKEQALLEASTIEEVLSLLHAALSYELKVQGIRAQIADRAKGELSEEQRKYILREQLRAIQTELGETGDEDDVTELEDQLAVLDLPEAARTELERNLARLRQIPPASPEHGTTRSHLEFALDLPWSARDEWEIDTDAARTVLNDDHFGLDEVKERILEHLGVLKLNPNAKAPILCFVGPPGVGKTSLGRSIARAMGREFERQSLGGLSDEAELRGHRRTYVAAMPGRVLQTLRRAGTRQCQPGRGGRRQRRLRRGRRDRDRAHDQFRHQGRVQGGRGQPRVQPPDRNGPGAQARHRSSTPDRHGRPADRRGDRRHPGHR